LRLKSSATSRSAGVSLARKASNRLIGRSKSASIAVPLAALAAWQSMFDCAQLQTGERVLIHGAGGSVGAFAVQLAKDKGAYVIANDIAAKKVFLQELGADQIVDAQAERFEDVIQPVDVVLNFATDDLVQRSYSVLKSGGRYVTTLQQLPQEDAERLGIRSQSVFTQPTAAHLAQVGDLIDAGKLNVFVSDVFPLDAAQETLERRQTSTAPGKVVLKVR
jgi:NADPH:quinone reductase-like Zn-dependent oxidoreductase